MRKKVLLGVTIAAVLAAAAVAAASVFPAAGSKTAAVAAVQVQEGRITRDVFANGRIEAKTIKDFFIPSSGLVGKVHVKKGAQIKQGQELLTISTTALEKELKEVQLQLELNTAEKAKFLSDEEKTRKQTFEAMKQEMSESGTSKSMDDIERSSEADVKLYDLKIQDARTRIQDIQKRMGETRLVSDMDGTVTEVSVKEGQEVAPGAAAFTITNVSQLQVKANLSENDANLARTGMKVTVTGEAFQASYSGTIAAISQIAVPSELDPKESVVEMTVDLDQSAEELRPGFKTVVQLTAENAPKLIIPLSSVKRDGPQSYVFKIADGKAVRTNIKLGEENDESVEVLEGLQANDAIVQSPTADLQDGTVVEVK